MARAARTGQNNLQQPSGYAAPGLYHNTSPISVSVPALANLLQPFPSNTRPKQNVLSVTKFKFHWWLMDDGKDTKVSFQLPWLKDLEYYPHGIQAIQTAKSTSQKKT